MEDRTVRTTCGICQIGCGVLARVADGRVVKVEGDPDNPLNQGKLCPKGMASLEYLYHPGRVRQPLKAVGKRGEGKWLPISWDEALDLIASKLTESKEKYGPESVVFMRGAAKGLQDDYLTRFGNVFGSPNITSMAHVCFVPRRIASSMTYGFYAIPDLDYPPKCIIVWGENATETLHHVDSRIMRAVKNGATLIVIDPYKNETAESAQIWVKLRPGSDLAFALSLLNVIINESLDDSYFVEHHTTGYEELRTHIQQYSPEKMSDITWVSPEVIREVARIYAKNRPACIQWGNGIDHSVSNFQTARAICILRAITGNVGIPGGELKWLPPPILERGSPAFSLYERIPPALRQKRITGEKNLLPAVFYALPQAVIETILTDNPYSIRCAYVQGCNPLLTYPNAKKVHQALEKLNFLVVSDMFMTPTALLADLVLPAVTYLEFDSIVAPPYSLSVATVQQKVTSIHDCRSDYRILQGLAAKMGLGESFWETEEECLDSILSPAGITFKEFRDIAVLQGTKRYRAHRGEGFPTPSKKVEFFSQKLKESGFDPLPAWHELGDRLTATKCSEEYPMIFTTLKRAPFRHSGGRQIGTLREMHPEPLVLVHPETAKRIGVAEGDQVCIETEIGRIIQRAAMNKEIDPKVALLDYGWWFPEEGEASSYGWERSNVNIIVGDTPPYGKEMGTPTLRGLHCRIYKSCDPS